MNTDISNASSSKDSDSPIWRMGTAAKGTIQDFHRYYALTSDRKGKAQISAGLGDPYEGSPVRDSQPPKEEDAEPRWKAEMQEVGRKSAGAGSR